MGKKMNVGIVGFGSIGTEVAKALIEGVENFYLYGITSRSKTNAEKRISKLKKSIKIFEHQSRRSDYSDTEYVNIKEWKRITDKLPSNRYVQKLESKCTKS